jgi:hypothetical protein
MYTDICFWCYCNETKTLRILTASNLRLLRINCANTNKWKRDGEVVLVRSVRMYVSSTIPNKAAFTLVQILHTFAGTFNFASVCLPSTSVLFHSDKTVHVFWHVLRVRITTLHEVNKRNSKPRKKQSVKTCVKHWLTSPTFYAPSQNCEKRLLIFSCPSVRIEQLGSQWTYFGETWYLSFFENLSRKSMFH